MNTPCGRFILWMVVGVLGCPLWLPLIPGLDGGVESPTFWLVVLVWGTVSAVVIGEAVRHVNAGTRGEYRRDRERRRPARQAENPTAGAARSGADGRA